jgi:hypothetical protein
MTTQANANRVLIIKCPFFVNLRNAQAAARPIVSIRRRKFGMSILGYFPSKMESGKTG